MEIIRLIVDLAGVIGMGFFLKPRYSNFERFFALKRFQA